MFHRNAPSSDVALSELAMGKELNPRHLAKSMRLASAPESIRIACETEASGVIIETVMFGREELCTRWVRLTSIVSPTGEADLFFFFLAGHEARTCPGWPK